jgi:hypothetical protein
MLSALPAYPHQVPFADEVPYISRCGVGGVIAVLAGPCWLLLSCPIGCVLQLQQSSQLISLAASLFPSAQTSRLDCLPLPCLLSSFWLVSETTTPNLYGGRHKSSQVKLVDGGVKFLTVSLFLEFWGVLVISAFHSCDGRLGAQGFYHIPGI